MAQRITINVAGEEKFIGMLEGGTLFIERSKAKHYYKKLNAYAMDKHLVESVLPPLECREVQLTEKETGNIYSTELTTILKKGLPNNYHGHGSQLFLPIRYWKKL